MVSLKTIVYVQDEGEEKKENATVNPVEELQTPNGVSSNTSQKVEEEITVISPVKSTIPKEFSPATTTSSSTPTSPEYSLSARLELAASHANLSEALVALETWCRMVGPDIASKEFFECQALEILLQKLLAAPALIQKAEVKDALVALFLHVFPSSPTSSENSMNAALFVRALDSFFAQMAQLNLLRVSSENSSPLAIRLSDSLRAVHNIFTEEQVRMQDKGSKHEMESDILSKKNLVSELHKKISAAGGSSVNGDIADVDCSAANIREVLELSDVTQDLMNLQLQVLACNLIL